jgi:hypothetical protein
MTAAERFKERIANLERLRYREAIDRFGQMTTTPDPMRPRWTPKG